MSDGRKPVHECTDEELARFALDDIHRLAARVSRLRDERNEARAELASVKAQLELVRVNR